MFVGGIIIVMGFLSGTGAGGSNTGRPEATTVATNMEQGNSKVPTHIVQNIKQHLGSGPSGPISRLSSAYSNVVYMFDVNGDKYVYKEFQKFDPQEERVNNVVGKGRVIASTSEFRIEKCLEGRQAVIKRDLKKIASELRRFHTISISGLRSYEEMVSDIMARCIGEVTGGDGNHHVCREEVLETMGQAKDYIIQLFMDVKDRVFQIPTGPFDAVMCHNDLQPGNILVTDRGAVFIDFEFAAMGSPVIDIANLFCEAAYDYGEYAFHTECLPNDSESIEFMEEYMRGHPHVSRTMEMMPLVWKAMGYSHFLWYLWAVCNSRMGCAENFDYSKYGNSRLLQLHDSGIVSWKEYLALRIRESPSKTLQSH